MIKCSEETYIAITDLAKLRIIGRLMTEVYNREAILKTGQEIYAEIDRLEKLIDASGQAGGA